MSIKQKEIGLEERMNRGCHELDCLQDDWNDGVSEIITDVCVSNDDADKFLTYIQTNCPFLFNKLDCKGVIKFYIEMHSQNADEEGVWE